jgi:hypothetical protein
MSKLQPIIIVAVLPLLPAAVDAAVPSLAATGLASTARTIELGGPVRIEGLRDRDAARAETFVGERFAAFTSDARIVVVGETGPSELGPPDNVYFKGALEGVAGSRVLISVLENGTVRGIATDWSGAGLLLTSPEGFVELRRVDPGQRPRREFSCGQSGLSTPFEPLMAPALARPVAGFLAPPPAHTARVAVDTDFEFYQLFGNTLDAANYVADIIAFLSILYEDEVDTSIQLPYLRLWTTAADPWAQGSTTCNLFDFGKRWNDTQGAVSRTIAHMMSGKNNGGGVAWVGVLCSGAFDFDTNGYGCTFANSANYGGGYGYTGSMDGDFVYENPGVLWDTVATAHEIGHNFNSPHTHCYANVEGNPSVVDACYAGECGNPGCHCGAVGFPGAGTASGGGQGTGSGTVMSYCHLRPGFFSNVTFTFGEGHPFGVAPDRVPSRMASHVAAVSGANAACLAFVPGSSVIFRHGFDAGSTTGWSSVAP